VDSRRSRTRAARIAVRRYNRARLSDAVLDGARVRLLSCRELPDSVEAIFDIAIETEGAEKPCCVAEWILRYYS
jgi:hypothetical protein